MLRALRTHGSLSTTELVKRTGLSRASVWASIASLHDEGLLDEVDRSGPRAAGRPATVLALHRRAGLAVGVDLDKTHLRVAVSDLAHAVLAELDRPLPQDLAARAGAEAVGELVLATLAAAGGAVTDVVGVGIGLPGPVHGEDGSLGSATILPGWAGAHPRQLLSEQLGLPVVVDNDANLGVLAELTWGAARGLSQVTYLKCSTGTGAGLVIDGRVYRGAGGTAREFGPTGVDPRGPVCRCGNRGCLETLVGTQALIDLLTPSRGVLTVDEIVARALAGDGSCTTVLADAGAAIGAACATVVNLLNPEAVVVGGELAAAGELVLGPLRQALRRSAIASAGTEVSVVPGQLGERAGVLGALALALREGPGEVTVPAAVS